jgi:hypothetical protein
MILQQVSGWAHPRGPTGLCTVLCEAPEQVENENLWVDPEFETAVTMLLKTPHYSPES